MVKRGEPRTLACPRKDTGRPQTYRDCNQGDGRIVRSRTASQASGAQPEGQEDGER